MFFIIKKRNAMLYILGVFCIIALCIAFGVGSLDETSVNNTADFDEKKSEELLPGEAVEVANYEDELSLARNNREYNRSKTTEALRLVIDDKSTSSDARKKAEDNIFRLADEINKESKIESLLLTKGYRNCVAFVSDGTTTLTIKTEKLEKKDMAKITDIIYGITGNNIIKIVEVKWILWYNQKNVLYFDLR